MENNTSKTMVDPKWSGITKAFCLLVIVVGLSLSIFQAVKHYDGLITLAILVVSNLPLILLAVYCISKEKKVKHVTLLLALLAVIAQLIVFGISGYQWQEFLVGNLMFILTGVNVLLLVAFLFRKDASLIFVLEALLIGMAFSQVVFEIKELNPGILLIAVFVAKHFAYRHWQKLRSLESQTK